MATDVEGVALDFGGPSQRFLRRMSVEEAERHLREGQFPPGSMGPKVEAAMQFIRQGGSRAVIASIEQIEEAIAGRAGTEFVP